MKVTFSILIDNNVSNTYDIDVYNDDTIENIKFKLSNSIANKNIKQYYFFYKRSRILNPYDVYKQLSENDTILIDKKTFYIFCINHNLKSVSDKPYYNLDDVLQLNFEGENEVNEPIGVEQGNYVVNPFENIFNYTDNNSTTSNKLLLDYSDVNTIYVCFAENIMEYSQKNKLVLENIINVYYPFLFQDKIFSIEQLKPEFFDSYVDYNNMIDLHHKTYDESEPFHSKETGISSIYFVLYTKQPFVFPIEIFFKLMQSTIDYPYIKLNLGKKQENIYRLYSPYVSLNGNKAPYFDKAKLMKFKNLIKKNEVISYVVKFETFQILLEIDLNGYIY